MKLTTCLLLLLFAPVAYGATLVLTQLKGYQLPQNADVVRVLRKQSRRQRKTREPSRLWPQETH